MDLVLYWKEDSSFQQVNQFVSGLKVISDAAGRSVQFESDYNEISTTNEILTITTKHISGCVTNTRNFCLIKTNLFSKKYLIFLFLISLETLKFAEV